MVVTDWIDGTHREQVAAVERIRVVVGMLRDRVAVWEPRPMPVWWEIDRD